MLGEGAVSTPPKRPGFGDGTRIPPPVYSMPRDVRRKIPPPHPAPRRHPPADKPPSEPPMTNARGLLFLALIFALRSRQSRRPALRHPGCRLRFSRQG